MDQSVILIVGVIFLVLLYLYFAGVYQDTFPHRYKQFFKLAEMSKEDASTVIEYMCEDPGAIKNSNETLLKIVRVVQGKDEEKEKANELKLGALGRNCICTIGNWNNEPCKVTDGGTCGVGTKVSSRVVSGHCPDEETTATQDCTIICTAADADAELAKQPCAMDQWTAQGECVPTSCEWQLYMPPGGGLQTEVRTPSGNCTGYELERQVPCATSEERDCSGWELIHRDVNSSVFWLIFGPDIVNSLNHYSDGSLTSYSKLGSFKNMQFSDEIYKHRGRYEFQFIPYLATDGRDIPIEDQDGNPFFVNTGESRAMYWTQTSNPTISNTVTGFSGAYGFRNGPSGLVPDADKAFKGLSLGDGMTKAWLHGSSDRQYFAVGHKVSNEPFKYSQYLETPFICQLYIWRHGSGV
jgi:hypothetical protein